MYFHNFLSLISSFSLVHRFVVVALVAPLTFHSTACWQLSTEFRIKKKQRRLGAMSFVSAACTVNGFQKRLSASSCCCCGFSLLLLIFVILIYVCI